MQTKKCSQCKEEKELSFYYKSKDSKSGVKSFCKMCSYEIEKKSRNKNIGAAKEKTRLYKIKNKHKIDIRYKEWRIKNKEKYDALRRDYVIKNKEKAALYQKEYRIVNKHKLREYQKNKLKTDVLYKLSGRLRGRVRGIFKSKNISKNGSAVLFLGINLELFKRYLERKFKKGMTWENHGINGWHIDHIVPLASAKTEEELIKLCHYTNLQPLWAKENFNKSDKIPQVQIKLTL